MAARAQPTLPELTQQQRGFSMIKQDTEKNRTIIYNYLYSITIHSTDEEIIRLWKTHQNQTQSKNDIHWIWFTVCEDILRQRENTYLDDRYPRD